MPGQHPGHPAHPDHPQHPQRPEHPDFEDTAVLPHIEGPPLVRPYVSATTPSVADQDPVLPALAYEPVPYRTTTPGPAYEYQGGRAERRVQERGRSGRRRAVILAAGAGIAAVGAGLALVLTPSGGGTAAALPRTTDSTQPDLLLPAPSVAPAAATKSASPSASRTSASRKPSPSASRTPSASASPTPPPTPSPSAVTSSAPPPPVTQPPSSAPPTSTGPRTLTMGMSGADVSDVQQQLADALFWKYDSSLVTGTFDAETQRAVKYFQRMAAVSGDPSGVYGPNTREAMANYAG